MDPAVDQWEIRPPQAAPATSSGEWDVRPPASSGPPSVSALTPEMLTRNPHGEGTYAMIGPDGKTYKIPYSNVRGYDDPHSDAAATTRAIHNQGFHFASEDEQKRFLKDLKGDPVYGHGGYGNGVIGWLHDHGGDMTIGALRQFVSGVTGMSDIAYKVEDYLAGRPVEHKEDDLSKRMRAFAAEPERTFGEKAGGFAENVAEIVVPESELGKLGKLGKATEVAERTGKAFREAHPAIAAVGSTARHAVQAGVEQGAQQYVHSGGDPEQAWQAAKAGGMTGGLLGGGSEILSAANPFARNVLRGRMGIGEYETKKLVDKVTAENEEIEKKAAAERAKNAEALTEATSADDAARIHHNDTLLNQWSVNTQRRNLQDGIETLRKRVWDRLRNQRDAARAYFGSAYRELEKAGVQAGKQPVTFDDLAEDAHDALQKVKGSAEKPKSFADILTRFKQLGAARTEEGIDPEKLESLQPDERLRLNEHVEETAGVAAGVPLDQLNGYYSELGRIAREGSGYLGDVRTAAKTLQKKIDERIREAYGDEVFKRNQLIRSQYRNFAEGYLDRSGPAASPVAQSVAAGEHFHGTQRPFLTKDARQPAVRTRVKGIVLGAASDPSTQYLGRNVADSYTRAADGTMVGQGNTTPAWRYRKQTHEMIEQMRQMQERLEQLPTAADLEKKSQLSAKAATKAKSGAEAAGAGTPEETPRQTTLTPAELKKEKEVALNQFAHNVSKFGTWMAMMGPVAGTAEFLKTGGLLKSLRTGVIGVGAGLVSPYLIGKMLERSGVVESLTRLSRRDLQLLASMPNQDREAVEDMLRALSKEAVRKGKIRADRAVWLRVLGGEAGRRATVSQGATPSMPVNEQDVEKELQEMEKDQALPQEQPQ